MSLTVFGASRPPNITSQLATASETSSEYNPEVTDSIENLPTATWHGRRFVLEDLISKKGQRGRTSWIKSEGLFVREILDSNKLGEVFWVCRRCDEHGDSIKPFKASATSSATDHLRRRHRIIEGPNPQSSGSSESDDLNPPSKRLRTTYISKASVQALQELAIGFIIEKNLPFNIFESKFLRCFLQQLNPELYKNLSLGRSSLRSNLDQIFNIKREEVEKELHNTITKIHISFDLWTSPNRFSIIAVTAHYINSCGKRQQRLLSLQEQCGSHTGKNIASTILSIIQKWNIQNQLGTVIGDNALNNDTCVQHLFPQINPLISPSDAIDRRMRCYGHILNLVGRAFLYGEDNEAFEEESQLLDLTGRLDDELQHWRKKGAVGKLRNIVKFIRSSTQRTERFKDAAVALNLEDKELGVIMNNDTRWNSTYMMISRALEKQTHIRAFLIENQFEENSQFRLPQEDILSSEDWRLLVEIHEILQPLYLQTMRCQGLGKEDGFGQLWEVMTGIEYLLDDLEGWKAFFTAPTDDQIQQSQSQMQSASSRRPRRGRKAMQIPISGALPTHTKAEYLPSTQQHRLASLREDSQAYLRVSITNAWQKLNEYYIKLGESPLFSAAVILHPSLSLRWLEERWSDKDQLTWLYDAKQGLLSFWERWYQCDDNQGKNQQPETQQQSQVIIQRRREDSKYQQWLNSMTIKLSDDGSELDRYYRLNLPQQVDDPIQWWLSQQSSFPTLSKLALDLLAIPAMAADCEREFSLAKLTLSSQRHLLQPETLEKLQCLKNWLHRDAISLGDFPGIDSITSEL